MENVFNKKLLTRCEFLRKLLEKLGLTWEIVNSAEFENWARYELIFRFYDKILKIKTVSISHKELIDYTNNELDAKFRFTFKLLAACYNAYAINNKELSNYIFEKLRPYIKFNCLFYNIRSIDNIDFGYMIENLILDGIDLSEFPDIKEVL